MKTSPEIAELAKALAAAQGKFPQILKDQKAEAGKYSYYYADLAAVIEGVKPALAEAGLSFLQSPQTNGKTVTITTLLLHASGQFVESDPLVMDAVSTMPQAIGSVVSYGRRYQLSAMLGIAAEKDDDGKDGGGRGFDPADEPFAGRNGSKPADDARARAEENMRAKAAEKAAEEQKLEQEVTEGLAAAVDEVSIDCYVPTARGMSKAAQARLSPLFLAARERVKGKATKCDRKHQGEACGAKDCWLLGDAEPPKGA